LSLVSPVFADLSAFPRLLFQVGEQKILRSDSERLAEKARKAGIEVKIDFRKLL
jgi:monoterpene epsilon-lactone hydrolase